MRPILHYSGLHLLNIMAIRTASMEASKASASSQISLFQGNYPRLRCRDVMMPNVT